MKPSAEVLKSLRGRKRWHAALERRRFATSLTLRDYIGALRPTAQTLTEAVCVLDTSGRILYANSMFQRMVGRAESALLGQRVCDFGHCAASSNASSNASSDVRSRDHRTPDYAIPDGVIWCDALTQCAGLEFDACDWRQPDGSLAHSHGSLRPIVHEGRALGFALIAWQIDAQASADPPTLDATRQSEAMRQALREVVQTERRLRLVEAVGDIALAQLPLEALLQALIDGIRREMELENVSILLLNEAGDTVTAHVTTGAGAEVTEGVQVPFGEGVVGEAMRTRRPVIVPNAQQLRERMARFTPELRAHMNVQSLLMVPLIVEDRPIGAISVGASEPNHFTREDVRLVEIVGERAALAIERAHASDEAARAHERLRFLNDASGALNATLDYRDITQRLATILTPALSDACAIYLLEEDGLLRKVATQAPARGLLAPDPIASALQRVVEELAPKVEAQPDDITSPIGRSVQTLTSVFERQLLPDAATSAGSGVTCNCVCIPLVVRHHALGTLYLAANPGKDFSAGDLELIQGLAERAAVAIDNARLYLETQQALASGSATATQLDTIFDATDVGIFVTDANGEFLRINPYGAHLLGIAQSSVER
ncbi:MAG TPA: GAF domain-containing protein, partial [Ktedonobacterales bacterium]|nr:GAF domain-containing protein [Ktedonobacterales bacterium]